MIPTAKKPPHIMSVRSRACCVKPLEHIILAIITFCCSEEHEWETKKMEGVSGNEGNTTTKQGVHWPKTKLCSESAYSSLSSETHLRALECSRKKTDRLSCFNHIIDTVAHVL